MVTGLRVGTRLPSYGTATGRVLLASLPDHELDEYLADCQPQARTSMTLIDRNQIKARIVQARREGVASLDQELEIGVLSLAIPVRDSRGCTQAAMSVSALAARVTLAQMHDSFLGVLTEHAERIGRML